MLVSGMREEDEVGSAGLEARGRTQHWEQNPLQEMISGRQVPKPGLAQAFWVMGKYLHFRITQTWLVVLV